MSFSHVFPGDFHMLLKRFSIRRAWIVLKKRHSNSQRSRRNLEIFSFGQLNVGSQILAICQNTLQQSATTPFSRSKYTILQSTVCMNDDQLPILSNPFLSLLETSGRPCRRYRRRSGWRKKLLVTRPTDVVFENAYCRRLYIDVGSMCICISSSAHGTAFFYATFAMRGRTA